MTNRQRFLAYSLPAAFAFLVGIWFFWPRTAITKENADSNTACWNLADLKK